MKMGDGDQAAAKPGFSSEGNPYQKPKPQQIWTTIFLKMGGLSPALSKMGGTRPPVPPVAEPLVCMLATDNTARHGTHVRPAPGRKKAVETAEEPAVFR